MTSRIIGIDPGLQRTGWGVIDVSGNRITHVANGAVLAPVKLPMADRLMYIYDHLASIIDTHKPQSAAVEETFVSKNGASTLKLGIARGMSLLAPAKAGLTVHEYAATLVKKSVTGNGHADKTQVQAMMRVLLPGVDLVSADAADALAVAICHAHYAQTIDRMTKETVYV